ALTDHGAMPHSAFTAPSIPSSDIAVSAPAAPITPEPASREVQEDQILQAVSLHSKKKSPAPAPPLAGLRPLSRSMAGEIIAAEDTPGIDLQEDKPEAFLGEIEVNAASNK